MQSNRDAALCVAVEKIETVTVDSLMQEPGDPIWRIEIDGFCIDFDFEQAANNVAGAINARLESLSRDLSDAQRERDELRAALEPFSDYVPGLVSDPDLAVSVELNVVPHTMMTLPLGAFQRARATFHRVSEHTEGGKPNG